MSAPEPPPPASRGLARGRAAAILLLSVAGLVTIGRFALDAWLVKAEPVGVPAPPPDAVPAARGDAPPPLLIAIVDGLRAEAAGDGPDPAMPFLVSLAREGASGVALTGEPTMTACCVRTILTGRNPDIYTAFANFSAKPVAGSVTEFLARRGARTAHAGDAAAWQMTAAWYRPEDVKAYPDRGPADQGETDDASFPFALEKARDPEVDLLTFHVVRPDHAGHKHGATGAEYRAACRVVDGMLREVVTAFRARRPGATVLVAADHGVTPRGNHGGGEPGARRAPFVLVGPRVAARAGVEIAQSSLAPTLAALLGLPQPPLAETPPAFDLTTIPPAERAAALNAYVVARLEVARRTGAADVAEAIEAKRARAFAAGGGALEALGEVQRGLDAEAFARTGAFSAALALGLAALWIAVLARAGAGGTPAALRAPGGGSLEAGLAALAAVAGFALPSGVAAGTLLAACAALAWRTPWSSAGGRALTLSGFAAVPVLGAAGLVLQDAFDVHEDTGPVAVRGAVAALAVGLALVALLLRPGVRASARALVERHPGVLAAVGGVLLGFPLTMRLFIDPFVHTPILFAVVAAAGVVALLLRRDVRARVPRAARLGVLACALTLFLGGRLAVWAWKDDWILTARGGGVAWAAALAAALALLCLPAARGGGGARDRWVLAPAALALACALARRFALADVLLWHAALWLGLLGLAAAAFVGSPRARLDARLIACTALAVLLHERSLAQAAGFAVLAVGCGWASAFPAARTRLGVGLTALLVLSVKIGAFHALGFVESLSTVDTGAGIVPGAAGPPREGGGFTGAIVANALLLSLKFSLPWVVLLAAVAHAFERDRARGALPLVVSDLAIAYAARGAAIVGGLWVWWRSSWWLAHAYAVYLLGAADVVLVLVAFALVGGFRGPTREGAVAAERRALVPA